MKKFKFSLFLTILLGIGPSALALSDISISGELDVATTLTQLPTRDQGKLAFSIPSFKLDMEVPLRESNEFFFELESAENRDATSKRYDTQVKEAYLSLTSFLPARSELRYGLIPDLWIELEKEQWDYDFWGLTSYLPLIKYKYTSWSDLGLMYQSELPYDLGQWALVVTNGEGLESDEVGPRKQFQLVLGVTKAAPFYLMASYLQGSYDNYDERFFEKRRLQLQLSYESEGNLLALEYFDTKDPADAITALKMAGGVDVTALAGTNVAGQGASLLGRLKVSEKWALFLRADWLNPVKADAKKNLQDLTGGFSYDLTEDILMAFSYEYTQYGENFSASPRDGSQFAFSTRVGF
jgi:hypothetical protein